MNDDGRDTLERKRRSSTLSHRFPFHSCSCEAARIASQRGSDAELTAKGLRRSFSYKSRFASSGVPDLQLTRAEFERRTPADVGLYREAKAVFDMRVRVVEERVGQRFSRCPAS